jgi:uncharacterized protein YecT (DUF1311 family)
MLSCHEDLRTLDQQRHHDLLVCVRGTLTENEYDALLVAEEHWEDYKNAHCKAVRVTYGEGSVGPVALLTCERQLIQERTREVAEAYSHRVGTACSTSE